MMASGRAVLGESRSLQDRARRLALSAFDDGGHELEAGDRRLALLGVLGDQVRSVGDLQATVTTAAGSPVLRVDNPGRRDAAAEISCGPGPDEREWWFFWQEDGERGDTIGPADEVSAVALAVLRWLLNSR